MKNAAVFLDRDGVIIKDVPDIHRIEDIRVFDFSAEGVRILNGLGFLVIVVTNQPQVAKGLCTEDTVREMNGEITEQLRAQGAKVDAVYYCPHHPDKGFRGERPEYKIDCACRKPKIGMIENAAEKFGIDLHRSFIIGDTMRDIKTGENVAAKYPGFRSVLVSSGAHDNGRFSAKPDFTADNLLGAAMLIRKIVADENKETGEDG